MLRFAADEGFDGRIVEGLRLRVPDLDIVTVQERQIRGAPDTEVLAWAASEERILLTHDLETMRGFAYRRVLNGERMPGVFLLRWPYSIGSVIEGLEAATGASLEGEWDNRVEYVPLR